jgi:hypothetical protein
MDGRAHGPCNIADSGVLFRRAVRRACISSSWLAGWRSPCPETRAAGSHSHSPLATPSTPCIKQAPPRRASTQVRPHTAPRAAAPRAAPGSTSLLLPTDLAGQGPGSVVQRSDAAGCSRARDVRVRPVRAMRARVTGSGARHLTPDRAYSVLVGAERRRRQRRAVSNWCSCTYAKPRERPKRHVLANTSHFPCISASPTSQLEAAGGSGHGSLATHTRALCGSVATQTPPRKGQHRRATWAVGWPLSSTTMARCTGCSTALPWMTHGAAACSALEAMRGPRSGRQAWAEQRSPGLPCP